MKIIKPIFASISAFEGALNGRILGFENDRWQAENESASKDS